MSTKKLHYYGFRYFGGDNTSWSTNPNIIAGELIIFNNQGKLEKWLSEELLGYPPAKGGGKRLRVKRDNLRDLGISRNNVYTKIDVMMTDDIDDFYAARSDSFVKMGELL